MGDYVLFNELRLSIGVPTDFDDDACDATRRILESRQFRTPLRQAVSQVVRQYPELTPVRIRISV
jgi:hypothetical protein